MQYGKKNVENDTNGKFVSQLSTIQQQANFIKVSFELPILKSIRKSESIFPDKCGNDHVWRYAVALNELFLNIDDLTLNSHSHVGPTSILPMVMEFESFALSIYTLLQCFQESAKLSSLKTPSLNAFDHSIKQCKKSIFVLLECMNTLLDVACSTSPISWVTKCAPGLLSTLPRMSLRKNTLHSYSPRILSIVILLLERCVQFDGSMECIGPFPRSYILKSLSCLFFSLKEGQEAGITLEVIQHQSNKFFVDQLCRLFSILLPKIVQLDGNAEKKAEENLECAETVCDLNSSNNVRGRTFFSIAARSACTSFCIYLYASNRLDDHVAIVRDYPWLLEDAFGLLLHLNRKEFFQEISKALYAGDIESSTKEQLTALVSLAYTENVIQGNHEVATLDSHHYELSETQIQTVLKWYSQLRDRERCMDVAAREFYENKIAPFTHRTMMDFLFIFCIDEVVRCCLVTLKDLHLCYALHISCLDIIACAASYSGQNEVVKHIKRFSLWMDVLEFITSSALHLWATDIPEAVYGANSICEDRNDYSVSEKNHKITVLVILIDILGLIALYARDQIKTKENARFMRRLVQLAIPHLVPHTRSIVARVRDAAINSLLYISENRSIEDVIRSNGALILESLKKQIIHPSLYPSTQYHLMSFIRFALEGHRDVQKKRLTNFSSLRAISSAEIMDSHFSVFSEEIHTQQIAINLVPLVPQMTDVLRTLISSISRGMVIEYLPTLCALAECFFSLSLLYLKQKKESSKFPLREAQTTEINNVFMCQLRSWDCFLSCLTSTYVETQLAGFRGIHFCIFSFFTAESGLGDRVHSMILDRLGEVYFHTNALPYIHQTWVKAVLSLANLFHQSKIDFSEYRKYAIELRETLIIKDSTKETRVFDGMGNLSMAAKALLIDKDIRQTTGIKNDETHHLLLNAKKISMLSLRVAMHDKVNKIEVHALCSALPFLQLIVSCSQAAFEFLARRVRSEFYAFAETICWILAMSDSHIYSKEEVRKVCNLFIEVFQIFDAKTLEYIASDAIEKSCISEDIRKNEGSTSLSCTWILLVYMGIIEPPVG